MNPAPLAGIGIAVSFVKIATVENPASQGMA